MSHHRNPRQRRVCTPVASGARPVTGQTELWSSASCLTCRWASGCCSTTWGPTLSPAPPPSMASKSLTSTMWFLEVCGMCLSTKHFRSYFYWFVAFSLWGRCTMFNKNIYIKAKLLCSEGLICFFHGDYSCGFESHCRSWPSSLPPFPSPGNAFSSSLLRGCPPPLKTPVPMVQVGVIWLHNFSNVSVRMGSGCYTNFKYLVLIDTLIKCFETALLPGCYWGNKMCE